MPAKEIIKGVGVDLSWLMAVVVSWLPIIQGFIGVGVTIVVFMIQIQRLKKLKQYSNDEVKEKVKKES